MAEPAELSRRPSVAGGHEQHEDRKQHNDGEQHKQHAAPDSPMRMRDVGTAVFAIGIPLLCVFVTSFSLAIVRTLASRAVDIIDWGYPLPTLGRLLGALVVILIWIKLRRNIKPEHLILGVCIASILEFSLYPFFGSVYPQAFHVFGHALVTMTFLFALMAVVELLNKDQADKKRAPALILTSALYGSMFSALSLGILVAVLAGGDGSPNLISLLIHTLAVGLALVLVLIMVVAFWARRLGVERVRQSEKPPAADNALLYACLADKHALTKRELDVLDLIRAARSVPYIAQELFISQNTVRHHAKSIYQKLGVHNKQQLLDRLEHIAGESVRKAQRS